MIEAIYILAKNEQPNIARTLDALAPLPVPIVVLDSGSEDDTVAIAERYDNVEVRDWEYIDHCSSYNRLTTAHTDDRAVMVLDADMRIDQALLDAANRALADAAINVVIAPVTMFWEGHELAHGHLYPPKPIVFRGGSEYFEPAGHGERLVAATRSALIDVRLIHDDRKAQDMELLKQWRYGQKLVARADADSLTWRDRLRLKSPLMILLTPLYAYIAKRGFLNGRAGMIYCIDRLVAEALAYRAALVSRLGEPDDKPQDASRTSSATGR